MPHQGHDRYPILAVVGALLLLAGLASAFIGPIEIYTFYAFVEGGKFHYEGFRFGSFMFANIACQVLFYYLIAALFVPLGYGHLTARRWARVLALVLLYDWLVVGLPLGLVLLFMLLTAKAMPMAAAAAAIVAVGLCYPLAPLLLIGFYRRRDVRLAFEARDPGPCRLEAIALPVLSLGSLYLFYALLLHLPAFMNGLFPFFGTLLSGYAGFIALDLTMLADLLLAWGTFRRQAWAWWASLAYLGGLTASLALTFARARYADILARWRLPATEVQWLQGIPIEGYHLAALIGLPLVLTLALAVLSRRHFGRQMEPSRHEIRL